MYYRQVDVKIEYCIPFLTVRYHIILGKSSPETGGEIRIPDGVYIFLHTFKYFIFRFFLGVFYFLYFIRNPFGSIYVIEFASFAACQDQHPQGCCTTEECYFIEMFHFLYFLIGNGLKRSPPVPVEPVAEGSVFLSLFTCLTLRLDVLSICFPGSKWNYLYCNWLSFLSGSDCCSSTAVR